MKKQKKNENENPRGKFNNKVINRNYISRVFKT